jgi:5-methylthioadenosine/S-adenosylhomocysteine deaminase
MRDSGIRGFMGRATRELNPDSGGRDPWYLPLDEVFDQMRQLAREFPSGLPLPSVLPAPGTVRTMTTQGLVRVKEYALAEGSQITIHMGEYSEERQLCIERWGMGAFAKMEQIGFLGPDVVAAHCVKVDAEEQAILARTGTTVSYNPVSNAYLGNGVPPIVEMLEQGVNVALATDGGACGNTQDMLEAIKFGTLVLRADAEDPRVINARDIVRIATLGGARALGLPDDLGALEVGRLADLFLFDPYRLKSVPVHDPISSLVYASGETNVDTVIVDGRVVMAGGRLTDVDEDAFVREANDRAIALATRVGTSRLLKGRRFQPYGQDRDPARSGDSLDTSAQPRHHRIVPQ